MSCSDPQVMHREGRIGCFLVRNDQTRVSLFYLTQLKIIFQRQLPKMPREYIARLIYDKRHESIILLSIPEPLSEKIPKLLAPDVDMQKATTGISARSTLVHESIPESASINLNVLGGITLRRFGPDHPFLEIVFCAISSTDQVRGYGAFLMCVLKSWVRLRYPTITFLLTYADNYAVGYFKKQGFSRQVTLDRAIWGGLIKDYDGGTLMECRLIPEIVNYLSMRQLLARQHEALMKAIRQKAPEPFVRHSGLANFPIADPSTIPGLTGRPWQSSCEEQRENPPKRPILVKDALASLLVDLQVMVYFLISLDASFSMAVSGTSQDF